MGSVLISLESLGGKLVTPLSHLHRRQTDAPVYSRSMKPLLLVAHHEPIGSMTNLAAGARAFTQIGPRRWGIGAAKHLSCASKPVCTSAHRPALGVHPLSIGARPLSFGDRPARRLRRRRRRAPIAGLCVMIKNRARLESAAARRIR